MSNTAIPIFSVLRNIVFGVVTKMQSWYIDFNYIRYSLNKHKQPFNTTTTTTTTTTTNNNNNNNNSLNNKTKHTHTHTHTQTKKNKKKKKKKINIRGPDIVQTCKSINLSSWTIQHI